MKQSFEHLDNFSFGSSEMSFAPHLELPHQVSLTNFVSDDDGYYDLISRVNYPGLSHILNSTYRGANNRERSVVYNKDQDWLTAKSRKIGVTLHLLWKQRLTNERQNIVVSQLVQRYWDSLRSFMQDLSSSELVCDVVPCDNIRFPYVAEADYYGLYKGEPAVVELYSTHTPVTTLDDCREKRLQLVGQVRAMRSYFQTDIRVGVLVVAQPMKEAEVFVLHFDQMEQIWKRELLPRLHSYYTVPVKMAG